MGVRYLLDTHVLVWLLGEPERLPESARRDLANPASALLVSAASALEVSTKVRLGTWPVEHLVQAWAERLSDIRAEHLPVEHADALLAGSLPWEHRDPFDRILAAQAIRGGLVLVTVDQELVQAPGVQVLTWQR